MTHWSLLLDKDQSIPLIKSKIPTRHLLIYATDDSYHSTMTLVSTELDKVICSKVCVLHKILTLEEQHLIRCVYPYLYSGMTIVSYYSLQEAQLALERFRKQDHSFCLDYAKPCLVNKRCNERVFVTIRQLQGLDIKQHHYKVRSNIINKKITQFYWHYRIALFTTDRHYWFSIWDMDCTLLCPGQFRIWWWTYAWTTLPTIPSSDSRGKLHVYI